MHILCACMVVVVQLLSRVWLCATPRTAALQVSLPFTVSWSLFKLMSVQLVMPSNHFILCCPLLLLPSSQHQGLFQRLCSSHQVAKVLELQHQCFQWLFRVDFLWDWLVWSPCCPRDTQESSPAPQVESISSFTLRLLYGPTLKFVQNYWINNSFDYTELGWQSDVSAF